MVLEEHPHVLIKWWIHALIPLGHQLSRDHNIIVQLFFIIGWWVHHMRFGILQACPSWFEEWVQSLDRSSIQEGLEAHLCVHIWPCTTGVSHLLLMFGFSFVSFNTRKRKQQGRLCPLIIWGMVMSSHMATHHFGFKSFPMVFWSYFCFNPCPVMLWHKQDEALVTIKMKHWSHQPSQHHPLIHAQSF